MYDHFVRLNTSAISSEKARIQNGNQPFLKKPSQPRKLVQDGIFNFGKRFFGAPVCPVLRWSAPPPSRSFDASHLARSQQELAILGRKKAPGTLLTSGTGFRAGVHMQSGLPSCRALGISPHKPCLCLRVRLFNGFFCSDPQAALCLCVAQKVQPDDLAKRTPFQPRWAAAAAAACRSSGTKQRTVLHRRTILLPSNFAFNFFTGLASRTAVAIGDPSTQSPAGDRHSCGTGPSQVPSSLAPL